jgi:hypothetical protein
MPRTTWTEEEDDFLKDGMKKHGSQWARIGKMYPQLVEKHPGRTALRDRAVVLAKHVQEEKRRVITDEEFDRLPDSSRIEWFHDELEALKDGWYKHGTKWQEIWKEYGPQGNGLLKRHKKENYRHRIIALQKEQMKLYGKVEERLQKAVPSNENVLKLVEKEEEKKIDKPRFKCACGEEKDWSLLLTKGLKCKCDRKVDEMLEQVENQVEWVVYVVLDENNDDGLSGAVRYVGLSETKRLKGHEKELVKTATFYTLRASVLLGESQLKSILTPNENVQRSGNKEFSDYLRIWKDNSWVNMRIGDNGGQKYGMNKEYGMTKPKTYVTAIDDCNDMCGLIFTNVGRCLADDDGMFCMRKGNDSCACQMKCTYRKILNAMQDKPIWEGIPVHEVKEIIRPYRQVVKVVTGEKNPSWTLEYCERVIERNKDIRETTMKDYIRKIRTLWESKILQKESFERPWELIEILRKRGTRNTAKSQIVIIMSLLSHMTNAELLKLFGSHGIDLRIEYMRIQKGLSEEEDREVQQKTEREKRNWVKREDIAKALEQMERDAENTYQYQRVVWYKMQTYMGPARNEWQSLKVSDYDEEKDNYVDLDKNKIVLNVYKTSEAMGRREFQIAEEVRKDIERIVRRRKEKGIEYMYVKMSGERFVGSEFSNTMIRGMERYLGRRVGSQMHRKIEVTEERKGEKRMKEKSEMSGRMLHSVGMSERYRRYS